MKPEKREEKDYNNKKASEISRKIKILNEERKTLIKRGKETERNAGNEETRETREKPRIIGNIQIAPPREEYQNRIGKQRRTGPMERRVLY